MAIGDLFAVTGLDGTTAYFRVDSSGNLLFSGGLGSASAEVDNLYIGDAGVLAFGADQDIIITHATASLVVSNAAAGVVDWHDDVFQVVDPVAPTKKARLDVVSVTAGQTRVITVPDGDTTLAPLVGTGDVTIADSKVINFGDGTDVVMTHDGTTTVVVSSAGAGLMNFHDDVFQVVDPVDPTKIGRFDAVGITAGQTRVVSLPDNDLALRTLFSRVRSRSQPVSCWHSTPHPSRWFPPRVQISSSSL